MKPSRKDTIGALLTSGVPMPLIRLLIRYGTTLQRLAQAQWADKGFRNGVECRRCEANWVKASLVRDLCPICRTQDKIAALCEQAGLKLEMDGPDLLRVNGVVIA